MIELKLTTEEARALIGLLDLAVKAGGLQAAQHALPISDEVAKKVQQVPSSFDEHDAPATHSGRCEST